MKLKELKHSLSKFGGDDDNSHVIIFTVEIDGKLKPGLISGVGFLPTMNAVFLSDEAATPILIEQMKRTMPDSEDSGEE